MNLNLARRTATRVSGAIYGVSAVSDELYHFRAPSPNLPRTMSRLTNYVKDKINQSKQHDFVGEVAPSRLEATRTSYDLGHRRNRSSVSPTPSTSSSYSLRRSSSHPPLGTGNGGAGADALDLEIRFMSGHDLPRMDVVGAGCDPYFRASIDGAISYT